jgi:hypothetical protein
MSTDLIRYDLLVQEALKSVVRKVLVDAAREGLPGEHHFYISFRTEHSGVRLSQRLREKYPQEMTIVLQHQFDQLIVHDHGFEVGLSFSGFPERLRVPFDALSGFFDPSVQFGLKFEINEEESVELPEAEAPIQLNPKRDTPALKGSVPKLSLRPAEKSEGQGEDAAPAAASGDKKPEDGDAGGTAEVVSLDSFRKKS